MDRRTVRPGSFERPLKGVYGRTSADRERDYGDGWHRVQYELPPETDGGSAFDRMKIVERPKKTKTGQYKTSEEELEKIKSKHPIIAKILEQRSLKKTA